jgi:hypothetical protein
LRSRILDALQQSKSLKTRWMVGLDLPIEGVQSNSTHSHSVIGARQSGRTKKLGSYVFQTTNYIYMGFTICFGFFCANGFFLHFNFNIVYYVFFSL